MFPIIIKRSICRKLLCIRQNFYFFTLGKMWKILYNITRKGGYMESKFLKEDRQLIFKMDEEIDECEVQKIRRKLDNEIERYMPKEVIFDFSNVSFMDSAGIGLIIGRYKLANMLGGEVRVANVTAPVKKIFEMSGMSKIIPEIRDKKNPVSIYPEDLAPNAQKVQNRTGTKCTKCMKEVQYE